MRKRDKDRALRLPNWNVEIVSRVVNAPPSHAHEEFATSIKSSEEPGCVDEVSHYHPLDFRVYDNGV